MSFDPKYFTLVASVELLLQPGRLLRTSLSTTVFCFPPSWSLTLRAFKRRAKPLSSLYPTPTFGQLTKMLVWFARLIVKTFFTSSEIVHKENVPTERPLLVVVNHNNQFIDAAVIIHALPRKASFIVAESSMHRFVVGTLARWANSVPVIRPQDRAVVGAGAITVDTENKLLIGAGTDFQSNDIIVKGAKIDIKGLGNLIVNEVISDTQLSFTLEDEDKMKDLEASVAAARNRRLAYRVLPKINQREVYKEVHQRLDKGGSIIIFPEGGSHDQPKLLPLKAGVAVMALGALDKGVKNLQILPVGINYFNASLFRSRVLVEVGDALFHP